LDKLAFLAELYEIFIKGLAMIVVERHF